MEDDDAKRLEVRLIDLSFRFKTIEEIVGFVTGFWKVVSRYVNLLLVVVALVVSIMYTDYSRAIVLKETAEMHRVTVAKIRYSIRNIGK